MAQYLAAGARISCLHLWKNRRVVEPIGIEPMT